MSVDDNFELAQRDSNLPGLPLVLDPSRVQQLLTAQSSIGPADRVELVYIRYKPGRRALSLMQVIEPSGKRRPLVVNACDTAGWNKSVALHGQDGHTSSLLQAESKCVIDWFPRDRYLRQAAKLFEPTKTAKILERVIGKRSGEPWELSTLAYKPRRRLVVKASSKSTTLTLKCYSAKDFAAAENIIRHVADAQIADCSPCVVGTSERYAMIASSWIEGETLTGELSGSSVRLDLYSKVGKLLAHWHDGARRALPTITHHHPAFSRATLLQLAKDIVWLIPDIERSLALLLSRIDGHIASFEHGSDVIHGDFYAKQIIAQGESLQLIDFDEVGRGHRYQDLGTFVGNLVWNNVRCSTGDCSPDAAIQAFVSAYEREMGAMDWPLFQTSVVAGILRTVPHAFRRGLPEWSNKMRAIFQMAWDWCPQGSRAGQYAASVSSVPRVHTDAESSEVAPYVDAVCIDENWQKAQSLTPQISACRVMSARLLRHKPGKRLLVEYVLKHANGRIDHVLGKARLNKSIDQRVLRLHDDLQGRLATGSHTPRALGTLPALSMWFQDKIGGVDVEPSSPASTHYAVGQALASLHTSAVSIARTHTVQDELDVLNGQFEQWLMPSALFAHRSQELLSLCREMASQLSPVDETIIHRDFYFDQVLSTRQGTCLLDLDLASMGPPELDVGNYLAHLDEFGLRNNIAQECARASDAFLSGYVANRPWLQAANVSIWRLLSLARLVAISQRITARAPRTSSLLDHCRKRCQAYLREKRRRVAENH